MLRCNMKNEREQGRPEGSPPNLESVSPKEQAKPKRESELIKYIEQQEERFSLLKPLPPERADIDSVGQPYRSMTWLEDEIGFRMNEYKHDKVLVEKLASWKETITKVSKAYAIVAYPFCKLQKAKEYIEAGLGSDTQRHKRTKVELNDEEFELLGKLTAIHGLPFDPGKRVYEYSEVSGYSPDWKPKESSWLFERYVTCRLDDE